MDPVTAPDQVAKAIEEARETAREQVAAAWQMQADRIRELLETGWRETLDHVFAERFSEVESRLREGIDDAIREQADSRLDRARNSVRLETTASLNNTARRLQSAEDRTEAAGVLLDSIRSYCTGAALFSLSGGVLRLERTSEESTPDPLEVRLADAPALASASESKDTVVAAAIPQEISAQIAALPGIAGALRVYVLPLLSRGKVTGAAIAAAGETSPDVSALELLTALAAPALAPAAAAAAAPAGNLVSIAGAQPRPAAAERPAWSDLEPAEQQQHLRAQRVARTRVSEMLLHNMARVREGRAERSLYRSLKEEIDSARSSFRREFFEASQSMVDYLHLELVRTLAQGDASILGPDYPGPLP